jgi:hypothetical protein
LTLILVLNRFSDVGSNKLSPFEFERDTIEGALVAPLFGRVAKWMVERLEVSSSVCGVTLGSAMDDSTLVTTVFSVRAGSWWRPEIDWGGDALGGVAEELVGG